MRGGVTRKLARGVVRSSRWLWILVLLLVIGQQIPAYSAPPAATGASADNPPLAASQPAAPAGSGPALHLPVSAVASPLPRSFAAPGLTGRQARAASGALADATAGLGKLAAEALAEGIAAEGGSPCSLCFPAGTLVATPAGEKPIEQLHAGDTVLAEDPKTGKVEPERVEATIVHPASELARVDLSDGSSVTVTADHPFYVDTSAVRKQAGWVHAGDLRAGDRLRDATGRDMTVEGVRYNTGRAVVYTLTVATDHTFFVGAARVLVHNADCGKRFGSGKPLHTASNEVVNPQGQTVLQATLVSGNMTQEEAARGFPPSSLATHTEARAARNIPLAPGDTMTLNGQYPPCPSCNGAMNRDARSTGARIIYRWPGGVWEAKR